MSGQQRPKCGDNLLGGSTWKSGSDKAPVVGKQRRQPDSIGEL